MNLHHTFSTNPPSRGFTLIELMVTIAIAAILLMIGIPSFQSAIASAQLTTQSNNFLTAVATARSEAIKNNTQAVICRSANGAQIGAQCRTGTTWADGWIVFVDQAPTATPPQVGAEDVIVSVGQAVNGTSIVGSANVANQLRFRADGTLNGLGGTIRVCKPTTAVPENARDLVINTVGRTRVARVAPMPAGTCPAP